MRCEEAMELLQEAQRGRLPEERAAALAAHLEGCAACRAEDAAERALTEALARGLPRRAAPAALRRRLEAKIDASSAPAPTPARRPAPRWRALATSIAAPLAVAAAVSIYYERAVIPRVQATAELETEAVNDHLRVLYSERPLEVESGGIHQVKPWFTGRLDFAPVVAFAGDDDFPLQGGAVSWIFDRKAATFVFRRRLHTISLFVFRADGLAFPAGVEVALGGGRARAQRTRIRGFNLLLWRDGELGYALVSDVDANDLATLGAKINP
jgi:anti-sigma factor RsiW